MTRGFVDTIYVFAYLMKLVESVQGPLRNNSRITIAVLRENLTSVTKMYQNFNTLSRSVVTSDEAKSGRFDERKETKKKQKSYLVFIQQ